MASSPDKPSQLSGDQHRVLHAFFREESGFFLTGGAALAGFHLRHRTTSDLGLFTLDDDAFARGTRLLQHVAARTGLRLEVVQESPSFRRYVLTGETEGVVVDLVREYVHQVCPTKEDHDGIQVDPAEEILANKLNALVGRMEERDLVDVLFLERAGLKVEDALPGARAKDGGCTPANLAWLLSQIQIADDSELMAGVQAADLRTYLEDLVVRLRRIAAP